MIDNWPPGHVNATPPPGLVEEIAVAEATVKRLREAMADWERRTLHRRAQEWVRWHEANGWPAGLHDYERLLREVADAARVK